ncbi:metal-dependent phosphohydrolase [Striga asiatica]|uniref:Metal-dependent phosphohydrolase n=1 Tax=Striga asiatica TaxID=4170 RepID=A0A5A7Q0B2_STRAF|nr:metal-dependent phosphohydrolase [Striga asiatica]
MDRSGTRRKKDKNLLSEQALRHLGKGRGDGYRFKERASSDTDYRFTDSEQATEDRLYFMILIVYRLSLEEIEKKRLISPSSVGCAIFLSCVLSSKAAIAVLVQDSSKIFSNRSGTKKDIVIPFFLCCATAPLVLPPQER